MSNFEIFSKTYLAKLIEPFLPGATENVTPIMYRAYTPDIFMLLFRTTGRDEKDHFFVSFQYDFIKDQEDIVKIVKAWIGVQPIQAIATAATDNAEDENDRKFVCEDDSFYKSVMLLVPRPKKLGYWSDYIVVRKGDDVEELLQDFTPQQRKKVKELLVTGTESRAINVCKINGNMEMFFSA